MTFTKGQHFSKEYRRKISEGLKGRIPWNKGKKMSKEWIKENRQSYSSKKLSESKEMKKYILTSHGRGYIEVYCPDHPKNHKGWVLLHRLIMEEHLGRYLTNKEVVHHINRNRADNRTENLELYSTRGEHARFHRLNKKGEHTVVNQST